MDIKLDFGPWETVFEGRAYGHSVEIVTNREQFYVVFIYEEIEGKKVGAIVEGYKALVCKGNMEAFINTLPKPCMGILKTLGDKTQKVFFISFDPIFIDFNEEDYIRKIDILLEKSLDNVNTITELARASSIELKELSTVSVKDYFQVIGDPFVMRVLLSPKRSTNLTKLDLKDALPEEKQAKIQLGLTKNREIVYEKVRNLYRTSVTGNTQENLYTLYIIAENLLLEGKQVIVFDNNNYFEGLSRPSKNEAKLKENLVEYEPAGFPSKRIKAKTDMQVSLNETNTHTLLDSIGCFDDSIERVITSTLMINKVNTPLELIEFVLSAKDTNEFQKLKTERVLKIIDNEYKGLFGKNIPMDDVLKKWGGSLGRAITIDTKELTKNERVIFVQAAVNFFDKAVKDNPTTDSAVLIPESDSLLAHKVIVAELADIERFGFGLILGSEKPIPETLDSSMQTKMTVVTKNDIAISSFNNPSYRVNLRPSLSGEPKFE